MLRRGLGINATGHWCHIYNTHSLPCVLHSSHSFSLNFRVLDPRDPLAPIYLKIVITPPQRRDISQNIKIVITAPQRRDISPYLKIVMYSPQVRFILSPLCVDASRQPGVIRFGKNKKKERSSLAHFLSSTQYYERNYAHTKTHFSNVSPHSFLGDRLEPCFPIFQPQFITSKNLPHTSPPYINDEIFF